MALTSVASISLRVNNIKAVDLSTLTDPLQIAKSLVLSSGTGSGKADSVYHDARALAKGDSELLNFEDGSLDDQFGDAIAVDYIKMLYIYNPWDANLVVGGAATSGLAIFSDLINGKLLVAPSSMLMLTFGKAGVDITGDKGELLITHENAGAAATSYDIVVVGASA